MFVGHLAVALAAKVAEPKAPLGPLVSASFGIDLLWPVLLLTGLEAVSVEPGARYGARIAGLVGAVVASHWVLDAVTHRPDLPLWPGGPLVGLGLWNSVPGTFLLEGAMFAGALVLYARRFPAPSLRGRRSLAGLVALVGLIWISGPFSPPPPDATAVGVAGLALWLLPFWAASIERNRTHVPA